MFTKTVFFVGFSFYIPEDSTARIAVSVDQTILPLRTASLRSLGCLSSVRKKAFEPFGLRSSL